MTWVRTDAEVTKLSEVIGVNECGTGEMGDMEDMGDMGEV